MISFRCRCSHLFSVPEDQSGGSVQCPECGLLNDVPLLGELGSLEADGTIRLGEALTDPEPHRLKDLERTFTRQRVDEQGREIDLRTTMDQVKRAGSVTAVNRPARVAPRYDPETGELITPLEVNAERESQAAIPMAKPVLTYSTQGAQPALTAPAILLQMFMPANIVVILFIFGAFVVARLISIAFMVLLAFGGPIVAAFGAIPLWIILFLVTAHYGNVIDETGRAGKDQLPRPLRDLSWHDDLWGMFAKVAAGVILCYWPVVSLTAFSPNRAWAEIWAGIALVIGTFFLPGVWLTLISSGSVLNLRPDRLVRTIWRCGPGYLLLPAVLAVAVAAHAWAGMGWSVLPASLNSPIVGWLLSHVRLVVPVLATVLLIGIYLAHFFCWYLGTLYRRHGDDFPWVWQEYERARR